MRLQSAASVLLATTYVNARPWHQESNKAVYLMTNNARNAVIGLPIHPNGLLGEGRATLTGGKGQNGLNSTQQPNAPDSLFSQSAVTVAGEYVFAVNPGSNTLSMFRADCNDPSLLTPIGTPATIPGDFPNTVAAAPKSHLVCVGTTGTRAGVSCTSFSEHGLGEMDALRPFNLGQSTPPMGPANTVSHVFFSADETQLYTTVKGDANTNNPGFFSVFPVKYGCQASSAVMVGRDDVRTSPAGTGVLFGSAVVPSTSQIFVTDPGFGVAVLEVSPTLQAESITNKMIPGQMASCWSTYSSKRHSVFIADGGLNRLVELSADDASIANVSPLPGQDPGLFDLTTVGDFVYALSPGNGTTKAAITVFDARKGKQVQHKELYHLGANRNAMGMVAMGA